MDFELSRRKKLVTMIEVAIIVIFLSFTTYQVYLYTSARIAENKARQAEVDEMLDHPFDYPSSNYAYKDPDVKGDVPVSYEGEHPYASVDLPYSLVSLTIETEDGKAVYTKGEAAGVNIDVKGIMDGDTATAVDLSALGAGPITLSGTGSDPAVNVRYGSGYSVRVQLNHAIQASFDKDGGVNVYNLQKGDAFNITYIINADSYKYPGVSKFSVTGTATKDGALSVSLTGDILTVSGIPFEEGMVSASESATQEGYGMPLYGEKGFVTYNFTSKDMANTPSKKGGIE